MPIIKFDVLNRWSGKVQFSAEIDCSVSASLRVKAGLALKWAYDSGAVLRGAVLRDIPIIPNIDMTILAAIKGGGNLDMTDWHRCETTHCCAGWAIHLAGEAGVALEKKHGSAGAGALIYAASRPNKPIPNFYASNAAALADIKACAAEQAAACGIGE